MAKIRFESRLFRGTRELDSSAAILFSLRIDPPWRGYKSVSMSPEARVAIRVLYEMPHDSNLEVAGRIDGWWSIAKGDVLADPFGPMAKAGLFQIGLPGTGVLDSYRAIAAAEQAIATKTGLLGLASAFAGRQMVARFFIGGFANQEQRATWLPRVAAGEVCAVIAISEPGAGAHPKHLTTSAEPQGAGYIVRGRKAWVTNGPIADVFLVLAVTGIEEGRKRYGLFLIPKGTKGLSVKPMPALDALAPATHCELQLDGCEVPATARIGDVPDAYPAMALPFRDTEDTVGTANMSGLLSWLLEECAGRIEQTEDNALRLGRLAGLVSLVHAASQFAVAALDGGGLEIPAQVIGVRLLARQIVDEIRELLPQGAPADEAIARALAAYDLLSSVAREPRKVRQAWLGNSLWSVKQ
jgi:acyl-CoA dehydrogenase